MLSLLLLAWVLVSVLAIIGFWVAGMVALVHLKMAQRRLPPGPAGAPASPSIRGVMQDPGHPLYPAARRLLRCLHGFGGAWLSGLLAGLALIMRLSLHR